MSVVRFDQIARECRETFKGSFEGKPIVGLEHIEPYDMLLKNYDVDVETTFTKSFKKGQILFGRRRAYQHKACVATIDGICSGDITVIEPIEGKVYPDLLPFIIQNDDFFEHAIKGSNGALSPRVKWEHMANFEVDLPSIAEQKVLAEKLWAAYEVKQSYLKMIEATEEMVKSQFIEMFGDEDYHSCKWECKKMNDIFSISSSKRILKEQWIENGIPFLRVRDMVDLSLGKELNNEAFISEELYDSIKDEEGKLMPGDIIVSATSTIGKTYLIKEGDRFYYKDADVLRFRKKEPINSQFFMYGMNMPTVSRQIDESIGKTTVGHFLISKAQMIMQPIPPMELQDKFEQIHNQADKSISELRKSIDAIDKVIKSLINENL